MLAQGRLRAARDRHHARWERSSCPAAQQSKKQGEIVRRIVESFLVAAGLAFALAAAHGDNYPSRRITLIAPWPPAGAIDTVCRELAPGVADLLGQPVVVDRREFNPTEHYKSNQLFNRNHLASRYSIGTHRHIITTLAPALGVYQAPCEALRAPMIKCACAAQYR